MRESRWKLVIFAYLTFCFAASTVCLWLLVGSDRLSDAGGPAMWNPYAHIAFAAAGCLGGTLYALRTFHRYYEAPVSTRFLYWYFMRPYLCGGTAMVLIILLDSGILLLQVDESIPARIGLSFLSGFGHGKFMEKLTQLTETLFNGSTTDAGTVTLKRGQNAPPGAATGGAAGSAGGAAGTGTAAGTAGTMAGTAGGAAGTAAPAAPNPLQEPGDPGAPAP